MAWTLDRSQEVLSVSFRDMNWLVLPFERRWLTFLSRHHWLACRPGSFCHAMMISIVIITIMTTD